MVYILLTTFMEITSSRARQFQTVNRIYVSYSEHLGAVSLA